jgi:hypothetical protein
MGWRLAKSLQTLQGEVNTEYPSRPTKSDGTIGDPAHAARKSDHNPNAASVVTAWDITAAPFCDRLATALIKDKRTKYVIWDRRIWAADRASEGWRPYEGDDPHTNHIHLSVSSVGKLYDDPSPWNVFKKEPVLATLDNDDLVAIEGIVKKYVKQLFGETPDADKFHVSLNDLNAKLDKILAKP